MEPSYVTFQVKVWRLIIFSLYRTQLGSLQGTHILAKYFTSALYKGAFICFGEALISYMSCKKACTSGKMLQRIFVSVCMCVRFGLFLPCHLSN